MFIIFHMYFWKKRGTQRCLQQPYNKYFLNKETETLSFFPKEASAYELKRAISAAKLTIALMNYEAPALHNYSIKATLAVPPSTNRNWKANAFCDSKKNIALFTLIDFSFFFFLRAYLVCYLRWVFFSFCSCLQI